MLTLGVAAAIAPKASTGIATSAVSFAEVQQIIADRCTVCHSGSPTQPGFTAPPKGVVFDTPQDITGQAVAIHQQTIVSKAMPIGNLTQMSDAERTLLDQWFQAGAKTE